MANYYATCRSNYFKVKDLEKFRTWCQDLSINVISKDEDPEMVAMLGNDPDAAGWPNWRYNKETDETVEIDLLQELSEHLQPEWVAILMEAGSEKLRYVTGFAQAVNSEGEIRTVSLHDIYEFAEELGEHITRAEY